MIKILATPIIYYLLLATYSLFFTYLAWRDLRWGIYLISAFLFSYIIRFEIGFVPMTLLEAMILIVFIVWLIKNLQTARLGSPKSYKLTNGSTGLAEV